MKKIFQLIIGTMTVCSLLSSPEIFATKSEPCDSVDSDHPAYSALCGNEENVDSEKKVEGLVEEVLNQIYFFAGVIAVVIIVAGGVMIAASGGNPERVKKAKSLILGAVIGLVIILLAFTITNLIVAVAEKGT